MLKRKYNYNNLQLTMKALKLVIAIACISTVSQAQTIFSYGNKQVGKQEFLTAFEKNPGKAAERKKSLNEYLDLYISFKLKVQAAYDAKLNNSETFQNESNNFKRQLAESMINDEADEKKLIAEAYNRSKKDIHATQIFIDYGKDTAAAKAQAEKAYNLLKQGKSFEEVLNQFSNDDNNKKTKGDIGFITVFSLPYAIETVLYNLKTGQYAAPYKGKYGYHIFKNVGERKAWGRRKVAQIMLALPPEADEASVKAKQIVADTIYQQLLRGYKFENLVAQYSNDLHTASNNGVLPEVGIGNYDEQFEQKLYSLKKIGEYAAPFKSAYGFHILKLVEILEPAVSAEEDAYIKQKIEGGDRLAQSKNNRQKIWQQLIKYQKAVYKDSAIYAYVDSFLNGKSLASFGKSADSVLLFSFAKSKIYSKDFQTYSSMLIHSGNSLSTKPMDVQMKEFEKQKCLEYYRDHYEEFNPAIQKQIKEFEEANLLFVAMDKNVWSKATEDSAGLKKFYAQHTDKYYWNKGVSGILITINNKEVAKELSAKVKENIAGWRAIVSGYGGIASADSARYEYDNLPVKQKPEPTVGYITTPEKSETDELYSFFVVTKVHDATDRRSFEEAKGLVINDYQNQLEAEWIKSLKVKYPVQINKVNWNTVQ